MDQISVVFLCLGIVAIKGKIIQSENEIFAFAGCNATLEWTLGTSYISSYIYSINVFNANGTKIATLDSLKCETNTRHSSMYCEVRNITSTRWLLFVALINVTESNSGVFVAQVQNGAGNETRVKKLKIIERPQIIESDKPIHDKSFSSSCKVNGKFDGLIYQWKLNGTFLNSTEHIEVNSSLLTFKSLKMVDKINSFSCSVCTETRCCIESEPYIPDSYYSLTSESSSGGNEGSTFGTSTGRKVSHQNELLLLGLGIVGTLLVINGFLVLIRVRLKSGSTRLASTDCRPLYQSDTGLNCSNSSQHIIVNRDRPLSDPNVQAITRRNLGTTKHPKFRRKSQSLTKLSADTQNLWNPAQKSSSLQTFSYLSSSIGREDSMTKMCKSEQNSRDCSWDGSANVMEKNEHFLKFEKYKELIGDDRKDGATYKGQNSSRHSSFLHEDYYIYSTIDEAALTMNHDDRANRPKENLPKDPTNCYNGSYLYDYATLPAVARKAEN